MAIFFQTKYLEGLVIKSSQWLNTLAFMALVISQDLANSHNIRQNWSRWKFSHQNPCLFYFEVFPLEAFTLSLSLSLQIYTTLYLCSLLLFYQNLLSVTHTSYLNMNISVYVALSFRLISNLLINDIASPSRNFRH